MNARNFFLASCFDVFSSMKFLIVQLLILLFRMGDHNPGRTISLR
jgi:hypothetical protein